jgi:general secretion pathway protein H
MSLREVARRQQGFTLLELLVVLTVMALGSAGVVLALRSTPQQQLQEEAQRVVAWLEAARTQARSQGLVVRAKLAPEGITVSGLPRVTLAQPSLQWLHPQTRAVPTELVLGPEPILAAQSFRLQHERDAQATVQIGTQGLRPFAPQP